MTDKQILDEVYRSLCFASDNWTDMNMDRMFDRVHDMKSFIEQEWQKEDDTGVWRAILDETSSTLLLGDDEVGHKVRAEVSYIDGHGTYESITSASTSPIQNINDAPVNLPVIKGRFEEDSTLRVDASNIKDADGIAQFSYQWQRSNDGNNYGYDINTISTVAIGNNSVMWNVVANTGAAPGSSPVVGGGSSTTFFAYDSEM